MLEPTKKPNTTGYVMFNFRIPAEQAEKVKKTLSKLGALDVEDSVYWEEVFPDFNSSVALRGARKREGLTQKELAALIDVKPTQISHMENAKYPIENAMAKKLAIALNVDYRVFL